VTYRSTDRPADHATRSFMISGIYIRSTVMWSNNNYSICRLLDWFQCFYHRTEQGDRRQQTSLRLRCGIVRAELLYFRNLSSVNAKLTLLSFVHASPQAVMRLDSGHRAESISCARHNRLPTSSAGFVLLHANFGHMQCNDDYGHRR